MENLILLDCDGVIIDMNRQFIQRANAEFGTDFSYEDITAFSYKKCLGDEIGEWILRTQWQRADLYQDNDSLEEGALEGIAKLRKMARVVVVSSAMVGHASSKMRFLMERVGISWDDIIFAHDKSLIERIAPTALLIDDGPHNLDKHQGPKIVYDRPWNREWAEWLSINAWRAHHWDDIVHHARIMFTQ